MFGTYAQGVRAGLSLVFLFAVTSSDYIAAQEPRVGEAGQLRISDEGQQQSAAVELAQAQVAQPALPKSREATSGNSAATPLADEAPELRTALLGGVSAVAKLPPDRKLRAGTMSADAVLGDESIFRKTTDSGNLVGKSISTRGVSSQQRTPITTDTRIRGERVGQVLASGSYWAPVRMDLDTMMNKIDSRLVESLVIVKGPYSPRYGPGFSFLDIDLLGTPRYEDGFQVHGYTSADYLTNGEQLSGRQTFFGGSDDWGFRFSYGHRTGNDYEDGSGTELPTSYNSRDFNVAFGADLTDYKSIEFNYLRLDQTGVEYPGLVFDTRYLTTDGYELKYFDYNPLISNLHTSEVWYNRTRFEGDTLAPGKAAQIPNLNTILFSPSGFDGFGLTDGDGRSFGYRSESIFGTPGEDHLALGADLILLAQSLNDFEALLPFDANFPLPKSESYDFGFYGERVVTLADVLRINTGVRVDSIRTYSEGDAVDYTPLFFPDELTQNFTTFTTYANANLDLTSNWSANAGVGFGQRPPTLTELYVDSSFIGSLQRGLTFLAGDHNLKPETLRQMDFGTQYNGKRTQFGANYYYAWIDDYITYDLLTPSFGANGLSAGAGFVNTNLATLWGVEAYGQHELGQQLKLWGTLSYVEGTDTTRNQSTFLNDPFLDRSGNPDVPVEPLPGIPPLESRVGLLLHDGTPEQNWGVEYSVRGVARQDRVARTLEEVETGSFFTMDLRGYKRMNSWIWTGGVENLTDRFYQEHLDYRTGRGVFRPGIGFYSGLELQY